MMNNLVTVKKSKIRAVEAIPDFLCNGPNVQIESVKYEKKIGCDYDIDDLAALAHGSDNHSLIIGMRLNSVPQFVRSGIYQLES